MIRSRKARLSAGIVLGVAALATPLAALAGPASAAPSAAAGPATYHGTPGSAKRLTQAATISSLPKVASAFRNEGPRVFSPVRPKSTSTVGMADAATEGASTMGGRNGVLASFNGLSDLQSDNVNGFRRDAARPGPVRGQRPHPRAAPKAVFEPINLAVRETSVNGNLLRPDVSLATLFRRPLRRRRRALHVRPGRRRPSFSPRSVSPWPPAPPADSNNTTADVLVLNAEGAAAYQFDTSLGGPSAGDCFGDQPKAGFDNNALVISTDEYCGPTESNYEGAIALVISKPQLVAEAATVNDSVIGPVSLAGNPVVGMDPAINTGTSTAYLVNSVPSLPDGSNNPVGNTLGLWTLTDSASVTTGVGTPSLTSKVLPSVPYAFPVPATSTGDGSVTDVNGTPVTSEATLNPDDSRLSGPVSVTRDHFGRHPCCGRPWTRR